MIHFETTIEPSAIIGLVKANVEVHLVGELVQPG